MDVDQISRTHGREREVVKVVSNHLANTYGSSNRRGQRSILPLLAPQCRVVFFRLHIRSVLLARPNFYTALKNLGADTIQGTIPVAPVIVLVLWNRPSGMR